MASADNGFKDKAIAVGEALVAGVVAYGAAVAAGANQSQAIGLGVTAFIAKLLPTTVLGSTAH